jgi:hypothetical protein
MGTAAGAAAARAKRTERIALAQERERARNDPNASEPSEPASVLMIEPPRSDLLMTSDAKPPAQLPQSQQALTSTLVASVAPEAVAVLVKTMRSAPTAMLKYQAARDLIQMSLQGEKEAAKAGGSRDDVLDQLARAVTMRSRAAGAVDAVPIREDDVRPDSVVHSKKAPD